MQHHGYIESNNPFLHEDESLESEDTETRLEAKMKLIRNEKYLNTSKDLHSVDPPNTKQEKTLDESNKIRRKLPMTAELRKFSESPNAQSDSIEEFVVNESQKDPSSNELDSSVSEGIKGKNIDCSTPISKEQLHDPGNEFPEDPQDIVSYERNYCNLV